jgi:hypothetical protein
MKSTVYLSRTLRPPTHLPTSLTLTPLLLLHRRMMSLHLNVSSASLRLARLFFYPVVTWSRVGNAPSTWLNSVLEEPSLTAKRTPLRLGRITRLLLGTQRPLHLKRRALRPQFKLSSISCRLRVPTEGRGGLRDGSALYADNVRFTPPYSDQTPDAPFVSLYFTPQDYNDSTA